MMNEQDVFDTVVRHLSSQGLKSWDPGMQMCCYRYHGLRCAVGCLIPDDEYGEWMEGPIERIMAHLQDPEDPCYGKAPVTEALILEHRTLLTSLQRVHDHSVTGEGVRSHLENIAAIRGLSTQVLTEVTFPEKWEARS